jgi:hypothetical protein
MGSGAMISNPNFLEFGGVVEGILRFWLGNLKGCNVGITDVICLRSEPWNGLKWHDIHTKFHDDLFMYLCNIKFITATI